MVALGLIFTALMSRMQLPGRLPGVLMAVLLGTGIHFALGYGGYLSEFTAPSLQMTFSLPAFSVEFLKSLKFATATAAAEQLPPRRDFSDKLEPAARPRRRILLFRR